MLLVIGKTKPEASAVSDVFNYMGIVSYGTTPDGAAYEFSNRHRAILFIHPEDISSSDKLIKMARTYSLDAMIFALRKQDGGETSDFSALYSSFDAVFESSLLSSDMLYRIICCQNERGTAPLGTYRLAGLDASASYDTVSYFDASSQLTKTESMILRFLIASYPIKRSAQDVLKYSFRSGKFSEPSSIRAHICSINAKLSAMIGKSPIISDRGLGYYLSLNED